MSICKSTPLFAPVIMAILTPHYLPLTPALGSSSWVYECFFTCLSYVMAIVAPLYLLITVAIINTDLPACYYGYLNSSLCGYVYTDNFLLDSYLVYIAYIVVTVPAYRASKWLYVWSRMCLHCQTFPHSVICQFKLIKNRTFQKSSAWLVWHLDSHSF